MFSGSTWNKTNKQPARDVREMVACLIIRWAKVQLGLFAGVIVCFGGQSTDLVSCLDSL